MAEPVDEIVRAMYYGGKMSVSARWQTCKRSIEPDDTAKRRSQRGRGDQGDDELQS
jgi:hypothetical protein